MLIHHLHLGGQSKTLPVLDNYEDTEDASGGCISASGQIDAATVQANPNLFRFGATFRTVIQETGQCVWGGRLLDPGFSGSTATLTARGWGTIPDRNADRLMYQSRAYADWSTKSSDPYNYNTTPTAGASFDAQTKGGGLEFFAPQGTTLTINDQNGFVFWSPGVPINRVAFTLDPLSNWAAADVLRVMTGTGPSGSLTQRGGDIGTTGAKDLNWNADDDLIELRIVRLSSTITLGNPNHFRISNLRVNGYALNSNDYDVFSASDVVLDICSRLGIHHRRIKSNGQNVLPLDVADGTFADPLDYVSTLVGWRWLVLDEGQGPVMDFGPWDRRKWVVADPAFSSDLIGVERYNHVRVPFNYAHGKAQGFYDAKADPDPFAGLHLANYYPNLSISDPLPDDTAARTFGQTILSLLAPKRFAGTASFTTVRGVADSGDTPSWAIRPAHVMHAGDTLTLPTPWDADKNISLRVSQLRRHATGVDVTFDPDIRTLSKFLQRRQRRLALRGR